MINTDKFEENYGVNPKKCKRVESFKRKFYEKNGVGSWLDDMQLEIIYKIENDLELDDYLQEIIQGVS